MCWRLSRATAASASAPRSPPRGPSEASPAQGALPVDAQLALAIEASKADYMGRTGRAAPRSAEQAAAERERLATNLRRYGLAERPVPADGHCQFRALALFVYGDTREHLRVRSEICMHIRLHAGHYGQFIVCGDDRDQAAVLEKYVQRMSRADGPPGAGPEWGDHLTLQAAADAYQLAVTLVTSHAGNGEVHRIAPRPLPGQQSGPASAAAAAAPAGRSASPPRHVYLSYLDEPWGEHYNPARPLRQESPATSPSVRSRQPTRQGSGSPIAAAAPAALAAPAERARMAHPRKDAAADWAETDEAVAQGRRSADAAAPRDRLTQVLSDLREALPPPWSSPRTSPTSVELSAELSDLGGELAAAQRAAPVSQQEAEQEQERRCAAEQRCAELPETAERSPPRSRSVGEAEAARQELDSARRQLREWQDHLRGEQALHAQALTEQARQSDLRLQDALKAGAEEVRQLQAQLGEQRQAHAAELGAVRAQRDGELQQARRALEAAAERGSAEQPAAAAAELSTLRREAGELRAAKERAEQDAECAARSAAALRADAAGARSASDALATVSAELDAVRADADMRTGRLAAQLAERDAELAAAGARAAEGEKAVQEAERRGEQRAPAADRQAADARERQVAELERRLAAEAEEAEAAKRAARDAQAQRDALRASLGELRGQLDAAQQAAVRAQAAQQRAEDAAAEWQGRAELGSREEAARSAAEFEKANSALQARVAELRGLLDGAERTEAELRAEADGLRGQAGRARAAEQRGNRAQRAADDARAKAAAARGEADGLRVRCAAAEERAAELERRLEASTGAAAAAEGAAVAVAAEAERMRADLDSLRAQAAACEAARTDAEADARAAREVAAARVRDARAAEDRAQGWHEECARHAARLGELEQLLQRASSRVEKAESGQRQLQVHAAELQTRLEQELERCRGQRAEVLLQLDESRAETARVRVQAREAQAELERLALQQDAQRRREQHRAELTPAELQAVRGELRRADAVRQRFGDELRAALREAHAEAATQLLRCAGPAAAAPRALERESLAEHGHSSRALAPGMRELVVTARAEVQSHIDVLQRRGPTARRGGDPGHGVPARAARSEAPPRAPSPPSPAVRIQPTLPYP